MLSSNELARVREPLLTLQLRTGPVQAARVVRGVQSIEMDLEQLDAVLGALSQANDALHALPAPAGAV